MNPAFFRIPASAYELCRASNFLMVAIEDLLPTPHAPSARTPVGSMQFDCYGASSQARIIGEQE
jgi:hypothetical protein